MNDGINAPQITITPKNVTIDSNLLFLQVVNLVEGELMVMKEYSGIKLDVIGFSKIFQDNAESSVIELIAGQRLTWSIPIDSEAKE